MPRLAAVSGKDKMRSLHSMFNKSTVNLLNSRNSENLQIMHHAPHAMFLFLTSPLACNSSGQKEDEREGESEGDVPEKSEYN